MASTLALGLNHEQQHQELILTDLKHALASNVLRPSYRESRVEGRGSMIDEGQGAPAILNSRSAPSTDWVAFPAGVYAIGHEGNGFAFDNESPQHNVYLNGFWLASSLVTNGEYLAFLEDGGYERPELWLSDGWTVRQGQGWAAPLYWDCTQDQWQVMTLGGLQALDRRPVACGNGVGGSGHSADRGPFSRIRALPSGASGPG
jgi:formylglycine-generating enzyme required for sulfatase activity